MIRGAKTAIDVPPDTGAPAPAAAPERKIVLTSRRFPFLKPNLLLSLHTFIADAFQCRYTSAELFNGISRDAFQCENLSVNTFPCLNILSEALLLLFKKRGEFGT